MEKDDKEIRYVEMKNEIIKIKKIDNIIHIHISHGNETIPQLRIRTSVLINSTETKVHNNKFDTSKPMENSRKRMRENEGVGELLKYADESLEKKSELKKPRITPNDCVGGKKCADDNSFYFNDDPDDIDYVEEIEFAPNCIVLNDNIEIIPIMKALTFESINKILDQCYTYCPLLLDRIVFAKLLKLLLSSNKFCNKIDSIPDLNFKKGSLCWINRETCKNTLSIYTAKIENLIPILITIFIDVIRNRVEHKQYIIFPRTVHKKASVFYQMRTFMIEMSNEWNLEKVVRELGIYSQIFEKD